MARVLTNNIQLAYARESSLGTLPGSPSWNIVEPNEIGSYGVKIKTVARDPISQSRQRRKGAVVDLDSMVEFKADLTVSAFMDFAEGFLFSNAVNTEMTIPVSAVDGSADSYTVAALSATQAGKLQWESSGYATLIYARGFANSANNGLKVLDADPATTDTSVGVTDTGLVDETVSGNATIELCGVRAKTGDLAINVTSGVATLTNGENSVTSALDFTTLGLTVGQFIHIGGLASGQRFSAGYGYGRITAISATSITLDKLQGTLATDPGTGDTVDILFGRFLRNVNVSDSDYLELSTQFELAAEDLEGVGTPAYLYAKGNYCDEMTIELPLTSKAMMGFGFKGTDTDDPTTSRATNASSAKSPNMTSAFGTSSDIARLRITDVDETGLTTDFKNLTLTFRNSVSPEKVVGTLGAKYMNAGNFEVEMEAQLIFTEKDVITRMRNNTTVSMDFSLVNSDGALFFDIPSMTVGGGDLNFPVNQSVLMKTTCNAFEDAALNTSIGISVFPVVPTS